MFTSGHSPCLVRVHLIKSIHKYLDFGAVFVATNGVGALGLVCATQAEIQCGVKIEADIATNPIMP